MLKKNNLNFLVESTFEFPHSTQSTRNCVQIQNNEKCKRQRVEGKTFLSFSGFIVFFRYIWIILAHMKELKEHYLVWKGNLIAFFNAVTKEGCSCDLPPSSSFSGVRSYMKASINLNLTVIIFSLVKKVQKCLNQLSLGSPASCTTYFNLKKVHQRQFSCIEFLACIIKM